MKFNKSAMGLAVLLLEAISSFVYGQDDAKALIAAREGNLPEVERLVEQEKVVDVNAKDDQGKTLLMYAAMFHNLDIVKYLVDYGADIHAKDNSGQTALINAATRFHNLDIVKYLVGHGADIHAKDNFGQTALINAAGTINDLDVVKYLVDHGADIHAKDDFGATALRRAAGHVNVDIVKYLVDHGADIHAKNNNGATVLMTAAMLSNLDVVKYLVEHDADINAKDNFGKTALMNAAKYRNVDVVKYLVDHGADIHAKDNNGKTALTLAKSSGVKELLEEKMKEQKLRSDAKIVMEELTRQFSKGQKLIDNITLELWNKTDKPFWVSIGYPGFLPSVVIPTGVKPLKFDEIEPATTAEAKKKIKLFRDTVDTSKPTILVVKDSPYTLKATIYVFRPGKTIYIARRPDGKIGPQIGPLKGLKGVTESGLSLKNNVKEGDIVIKTVEVK